jgi:L-histidine Nalpha-methyltransferase
VAPKFLYDALGSRLFDAITELDEYYPTRTEAAIFHGTAPHGRRPRAALGIGRPLVDLGAGNGAKAARLFHAAAGALRGGRHLGRLPAQALAKLQRSTRHRDGGRRAGLLVAPGAARPSAGDGPALVFYPGSSIGNFTPEQALRLLRQARELAAGRRAADRRGPGQATAMCWKRPTTTRWASRRPST